MSRKNTTATASKVSAPPAPSSSSSHKSSILKSSFAPSRFQLRLFASVIQSFDSQQLRIHDTSTSRLRCVHKTKSNAKINCLDWGKYSRSTSRSQRSSQKAKDNSQEELVVAYGTSDSEVCIFSPAENKVVHTLAGGHERGIYDFKFSQYQEQEAWSIGGDAALVQWNLTSKKPVRTISLPDHSIRVLSAPQTLLSSLICASSTPLMISLNQSEEAQFQSFPSMRNPVQALYRSGVDGISSTELFLATDADRYLNIFDLKQKTLVRTLIAGAAVASSDFLSTNSDGVDTWDSQMLAVVTDDGVLELFFRPFVQPTTRNGDIKLKRKGATHKADAKVKLVKSIGSKGHTPIASASVQGPEIVVATVDGGVDVSFQKIRWQDEGTGELLFDGTKEVLRVKSASTLNAATTNGVKDVSKSHVDESRTVVVNGIEMADSQDSSQANAIEIPSSDEEEEEEDESEAEDKQPTAESLNAVSPDADSDQEMEDAKETQDEAQPSNDEADDADAEPTFGDLLASKTSQTIDIAESFEPSSTALAKVSDGQLTLPTGMSLGTVLTQSLRTNDRNLLEACLHTTDLDVVRNTIQRLDSALAGTLLSKLAERISSRPGRYGNLQTWVQQLCIAHGAAIASQPAVRHQVKVLYRVLDQRAKSLSHLMLLKGKLDMLDAQLKFRNQLAAQRALRQDKSGESGMIYIEGEKDNWSSEEDLDEAVGTSSRPQKKRKARVDFGDQEESDDENMPLANGISASASDSDVDEDVQLRSGTLIDDEAQDEEAEEDSEGDEVDSSEEEEEEDSAEDSEMNDFIDDDTPEVEGSEDEVHVDEETPQKPPTKKMRHR